MGAILCGGVLAQNTEQPATPPQATETDSQRNQDAKELLTTLKGIEAAIRAQALAEDIDATKRRELREEADLAAQQEMASWSLPMFLAAVASVAFTGIGILLIWRTLHHTRRAADAAFDAAKQAEKAAAAAVESIEITKTSSTTQLRAYLTIDLVISNDMMLKKQMNLDDVLNDTEKNKIIITVKNTGMSPAKNVSFIADLSILNLITGNRNNFFHIDNKRGDIGGGGIIRESAPVMDFTKYINENNILLLEGVIKYNDVFDNERVTEFTYHHIKDTKYFNDGPIWSPTEHGNNLT